jgi:cell division protease FtsH
MVTRYGMSETLGLGVYERENAPMLGGQSPVRSFEFSEKTAQIIDNEVKTFLDRAFKNAEKVIDHYRDLVEEASQLLIEKETLDETEIRDLWNKYQWTSIRPVLGATG